MAFKEKIFNPEFILVVLFSLVAMIGVGFGMFFIGREQGYEERANEVEKLEVEIAQLRGELLKLEEGLNTCRTELKVFKDEKNYVGLNSYTDPLYGVSFHFPTDWVLTKEQLADSEDAKGQQNVIVTSPNGSKFIYFSAEKHPSRTGVQCSKFEPKDEEDSNSRCIFIDGDSINFARVIQTPSEDLTGVWVVEEETDVDRLYLPVPESNFKYEVMISEDLEILDSILKSVEREL